MDESGQKSWEDLKMLLMTTEEKEKWVAVKQLKADKRDALSNALLTEGIDLEATKEKGLGKKEGNGILKRRHPGNLRGKMRFKAVIRKVLNYKAWLGDLSSEDLGEDYKRNVMLIKRKRPGGKPQLTLQYKLMFLKSSEDRTEEDIDRLYIVVRKLKNFRQYPEEVKRNLARCMYFVSFDKNRVVLRQGHQAIAIYFIMTGQVVISVTELDPVTGEHQNVPVATMGVGDMFGEVSLLKDTPRTATVTTLTVCEMLALKKDDFANVLKKSLQLQWNKCTEAMTRLTYFDMNNEVLVREGCILGKIRTFERDETIYGDGVGQGVYSYFLLKGQCSLIETLKVEVWVSNKKTRYRLLSDEDCSKPLPRGHEKEVHFMQVAVYRELQGFGMGEELYNRRIVAKEPCECLLLPTYWLDQNKQANIWQRLRSFLNRHQPTPENVFEQFVEERRWDKYRKNLVAETRARVKSRNSGTTEHDVPLSIRLRNKMYSYRPNFPKRSLCI